MEAILFRIYGTYDVYCVPHLLQGVQWMFLFMIFSAPKCSIFVDVFTHVPEAVVPAARKFVLTITFAFGLRLVF